MCHPPASQGHEIYLKELDKVSFLYLAGEIGTDQFLLSGNCLFPVFDQKDPLLNLQKAEGGSCGYVHFLMSNFPKIKGLLFREDFGSLVK